MEDYGIEVKNSQGTHNVYGSFRDPTMVEEKKLQPPYAEKYISAKNTEGYFR